MRLTYTMLGDQFARNIGKTSYSTLDATIQADFKSNLGQRYQLMFGLLNNYQTQDQRTASTVAAQQYYSYPPGVVTIDDCYITIGSVKYPLNPIYSQHTWDLLNAITIQATAIPQFIFSRGSDFGIYPIPQAVYTITFSYFRRDRNLLVDDYTTGTVTLTNASATVTGLGTTFTEAMEGRWFSVTSTSQLGQGYWYRIKDYTSATVLTLETAWDGSTGGTLSYKIGETPEIPEEGHICLVDGATADFYSGARVDATKATWWNNKFWTGDGQNSNRDPGDKSIMGGVLGLVERYTDRDNRKVITRKPKLHPLNYKIFASTLS